MFNILFSSLLIGIYAGHHNAIDWLDTFIYSGLWACLLSAIQQKGGINGKI